MPQSIIAVLGTDKPGIIARVTQVLFLHQANLEDISMTNLESELAMMMVVDCKDERTRRLIKQDLKKLSKTAALEIHVKDLKKKLTPRKALKGSRKFLLTAAGRDRTGIVFKVSRLFARHRLNISDLNSQILRPAPGHEVYVLMLEVDVPDKFSQKKLREDLKKTAAELDVDIQWKQVESLTF